MVEKMERPGAVTFMGNPLTLEGPELKVGDKAPDFTVVDNDLKPVSLADYKGKIKIICSVPSLDTPVCDTEARRFNLEAADLPENVVVLTISMDLPFAQKRWCGAVGVDKVVTLSDYQQRSFAVSYGVLIKELKLAARAVFVIDSDDTLNHFELVKEIASEPDYAAAMDAVKGIL